jgi:hypothetical protein
MILYIPLQASCTSVLEFVSAELDSRNFCELRELTAYNGSDRKEKTDGIIWRGWQ